VSRQALAFSSVWDNSRHTMEGKGGQSVPVREQRRSLRSPLGHLLVGVCQTVKHLDSTAQTVLQIPWAKVPHFPAEVYTIP